MSESQGSRLRSARKRCGFATASAAAKAFGWGYNTYAANENGNAAFSFRRARRYAEAFGIEASWLFDGAEPMRRPLGPRCAPIVGSVGHDAGGAIRLWRPDPVDGSSDQRPGDLALLVQGTALAPMAADGALIYFVAAPLRPCVDLVGHLGVLGTMTCGVLLGRPGQRAPNFLALRLRDAEEASDEVKWASPVTAVIPPVRASALVFRPS